MDLLRSIQNFVHTLGHGKYSSQGPAENGRRELENLLLVLSQYVLQAQYPTRQLHRYSQDRKLSDHNFASLPGHLPFLAQEFQVLELLEYKSYCVRRYIQSFHQVSFGREFFQRADPHQQMRSSFLYNVDCLQSEGI